MRVAVFCAAIEIASSAIAAAKEKKVVVSDAAALCSKQHSAKKPVPELDCSLTGTAKLPNGATPEKPRLGYDTNPWIVTGF
ncbi:hypothetical protein [Mesorhizobium sp. M0276]|uniref:hypothetical protein n=1 Tax=Mesorhizobium sp. M0276 TaxID=2956928 RepID=UPI00333DCF7B